MELVPVSISLGVLGATSVKVGDTDLREHLDGVQVLAMNGQPVKVALYLKAGATPDQLDGDMLPVVQHAGGDVAAWLSQIDPAALEKEALAGMGMGDGNVTAKMMELLRDWASGKVPLPART